MEIAQACTLFGAATIAGAANAIGGGGTLLAFPVAMAFGGLPATVANATSAVALTPGGLAATWAFRSELKGKARLVALLVGPSVIGGLVGAWLLRTIDAHIFDVVVPWMIAGASLMIVGKDAIWARVQAAKTPLSGRHVAWLALSLGVVNVYGGYFGAGRNLMMLAILSGLGGMDVIEGNAVKNAVASVSAPVVAGYFLYTELADLPVTALMAAGAMTGGYLGVAAAKRVDPALVRYAVVAIGVTSSVVLAYQQFF